MCMACGARGSGGGGGKGEGEGAESGKRCIWREGPPMPHTPHSAFRREVQLSRCSAGIGRHVHPFACAAAQTTPHQPSCGGTAPLPACLPGWHPLSSPPPVPGPRWSASVASRSRPRPCPWCTATRQTAKTTCSTSLTRQVGPPGRPGRVCVGWGWVSAGPGRGRGGGKRRAGCAGACQLLTWEPPCGALGSRGAGGHGAAPAGGCHAVAPPPPNALACSLRALPGPSLLPCLACRLVTSPPPPRPPPCLSPPGQVGFVACPALFPPPPCTPPPSCSPPPHTHSRTRTRPLRPRRLTRLFAMACRAIMPHTRPLPRRAAGHGCAPCPALALALALALYAPTPAPAHRVPSLPPLDLDPQATWTSATRCRAPWPPARGRCWWWTPARAYRRRPWPTFTWHSSR